MQKLPLESVGFAKSPVESKVSVLIVQHHRITESCEVEADLMHPTGLNGDADECRIRESFCDPESR